MGSVPPAEESRQAPDNSRLVCPRCRVPVPNGVAFCPHCGYPGAQHPVGSHAPPRRAVWQEFADLAVRGTLTTTVVVGLIGALLIGCCVCLLVWSILNDRST